MSLRLLLCSSLAIICLPSAGCQILVGIHELDTDEAAGTADAMRPSDDIDAAGPGRDASPDSANADAAINLVPCEDNPLFASHKSESHRYYIFPIAQTSWVDAGVACQNLGAYLAIIEDEEENSNVVSFMNQDGIYSAVWIGVHDRNVEGMFESIFGGPQTFLPWSPGEPNNDVEEDCVEIKPNGTWNDRECGNPGHYLCECDTEASVAAR